MFDDVVNVQDMRLMYFNAFFIGEEMVKLQYKYKYKLEDYKIFN